MNEQTGQLKAQRIRKDLLKRLAVLRPQEGDAIVVTVPEAYMTDQQAREAAQKFCQEVQKATGRDVWLLTDRERMTAEPPPRVPTVDVPVRKLLLPPGTKL